METSSAAFDHLFKILLVGGTGAGKTCFILRFADNRFTEKFIATIGIDFRVKTIERKGYKIKLPSWKKKTLAMFMLLNLVKNKQI